ETCGRDVPVRRASRRLSLRRPDLGNLQCVPAPERPAWRRPDRQRMRGVSVARIRVRAGHRCIATAVHREGADLRCARGGRPRPRASTAPCAWDSRGTCERRDGSDSVKAMDMDDEFFIGYAPPMPPRLARFVTWIVIALACGVMAWAVTVAAAHV